MLKFLGTKVRGGADKSLARPERKLATATKLGIYSTYSPRSSIHFLARCSNFYKPLKKIQKVVRPTRSPRQQWPSRRTKNDGLSIFFKSREQMAVSCGLQVPGEPGQCRARTRLPWWPSRGVFPSKCPPIAPAERSNTPRWEFGPLEDNQWGRCRPDPQKSRRELFQQIFVLGIFWGGGEPLCRQSTGSWSPDHSDITRFRQWSPIATGNHLDRAEKNSKSCSDDWHRWRFWSVFRHFGTHFAESFRMSKSSWMMNPTRSREMPSCSAIDLDKIRRSSKISSWIWSIISEVVNVFGSSRTRRNTGGKITTFKLGHPVLDCGIRWCMFP